MAVQTAKEIEVAAGEAGAASARIERRLQRVGERPQRQPLREAWSHSARRRSGTNVRDERDRQDQGGLHRAGAVGARQPAHDADPERGEARAPNVPISRRGQRRARTGTPNRSCAATTVTTVIVAVTATAAPTRPARNAHQGRGVPCTRLRIPCSRAAASDTARFENVVVTTP